MKIKSVLVNLLTIIIAVFFPRAAFPLVYLDINAPEFKQFPIAVTELINLDKSESNVLIGGADVLISDLKLTGLFEILDPVMFLEDPEKRSITSDRVNFDDWTIIGAEGLVKGGYKITADDMLEVEMRLFDTYQGQLVIGKKYYGAKDDLKRMMHRFANEIIEKFTGERGIFGSKITYIQDLKGYKEIFVMDYDGSNNIQITRDFSINVSPAWSPDGLKISYTSYKRGNPDLIINDFVKRESIRLSKRSGLNLGAEWSNDGKRLALTLSQNNNSDIYIIDAETGKIIKRVTNYWGIDVSPTWSPDDEKIAFTSDRSGNPNIYVFDLENDEAKRVTFNGKYNSSPAWSPDGEKLAFCGQTEDGHFNIFTVNVDGTGLEQLTSGSKDNESPTWSPDGRQIAFASNRSSGYDIYIINVDGANLRRVTFTKGDSTSPAWSPRLE